MRSLSIIMAVFFTGTSSYAGNGGLDSLFVAAAIGGSVNAGVQGAQGRLPEELKDWQDPMTQSTSRLSEQCGVLTEMKIVRTGRTNFLFLGIRNQSNEDLAVNLERAAAKFSSGRERYFLSPTGQKAQEVRKGWYSWGFLAFPRKGDFKDQAALNVVIPVSLGKESCELKAHFARDVEQPSQESSYIEAPSLVLSMGVGGVASRLGRLDSVSDGGGGVFDLYMAGFAEPPSGWYLQMSLGGFGDVKEPAAFENKNYQRLSGADISVGKAWRFFHSDRLSSYFNVGPSIVSFSAQQEGGDSSKTDSRGGPGLYTSYTLDWRYGREYFGYFRGDYSIGVTAYLKYYPDVFPGASKEAGMVGVSFEFFRGGD